MPMFYSSFSHIYICESKHSSLLPLKLVIQSLWYPLYFVKLPANILEYGRLDVFDH